MDVREITEIRQDVYERVLWWVNDAAFKAPEQLTEHYYDSMAKDIAALAVGDPVGHSAGRLDPPPTHMCDTCLRKTWAEPKPLECGMLQPDGSYCAGTFRPI